MPPPFDQFRGMARKKSSGFKFPAKAGRTYKQAVQGLFTAGTSVIPLPGGTPETGDVIRWVATRAVLAGKRRRKEKVGR